MKLSRNRLYLVMVIIVVFLTIVFLTRSYTYVEVVGVGTDSVGAVMPPIPLMR